MLALNQLLEGIKFCRRLLQMAVYSFFQSEACYVLGSKQIEKTAPAALK